MGSRHDIARQILRSIAEREQRSVADLDPLYRAVDPDALDAVAAADDVERIEFCYHGSRIVVSSGGNFEFTAASRNGRLRTDRDDRFRFDTDGRSRLGTDESNDVVGTVSVRLQRRQFPYGIERPDVDRYLCLIGYPL